MRRAVVALLVLGACGGADKAATSTSTAPITSTTSLPAWVAQQTTRVSVAPPINGQTVWVDTAGKRVFVEDCATAQQITAPGGPYGPSPRAADGSYTSGYASICRH